MHASMIRFIYFVGLLVIVMAVALPAQGSLTGNPAADGWYYGGNSLSNSVYVRGVENIGFDLYTTYFTVTDSSLFDISGHDNSAYLGYYETTHWTKANARPWQVGDSIIGVGGVFSYITALEAGWDEFTGKPVNSTIDNEYRMRLQAKIGTSAAIWAASTIAPDQWNGIGGTSDGGLGTVFVRTSGWHSLTAWENFAGTMLGLQKPSHIERPGTTIGVDAARVIWTWDDDANRPATWQLLVNMNLVAADAAVGYTGLLPISGDPVIGSVQLVNAGYTDALAATPTAPIPEPGTIIVWSLLGLTVVGYGAWRRRRRAA